MGEGPQVWEDPATCPSPSSDELQRMSGLQDRDPPRSADGFGALALPLHRMAPKSASVDVFAGFHHLSISALRRCA